MTTSLLAYRIAKMKLCADETKAILDGIEPNELDREGRQLLDEQKERCKSVIALLRRLSHAVDDREVGYD